MSEEIPRPMDIDFWKSYDIGDILIQERKRKEIFHLSGRSSKRAARSIKKLSRDVSGIQMALEATKNE